MYLRVVQILSYMVWVATSWAGERVWLVGSSVTFLWFTYVPPTSLHACIALWFRLFVVWVAVRLAGVGVRLAGSSVTPLWLTHVPMIALYWGILYTGTIFWTLTRPGLSHVKTSCSSCRTLKYRIIYVSNVPRLPILWHFNWPVSPDSLSRSIPPNILIL